MKKVLLIFTIAVFLISSAIPVYAAVPQLTEGGFVLIDSVSGEVLLEQNSTASSMYPASTTKIMTAALALELGDLDQVMTASQAAVNDIGKDGSNIGIMAGEQMKLSELLKALLISSGNETGNIIAENLCETREDFVQLMNEKAASLGATGTHFSNPCGAHAEDHYTTPSDMAKIARYAMSFEEFRNIVKIKTYQLEPTNKHPTWPLLSTTNKLMQYDSGENFIIDGVKTGFTTPAGYCLVSSATDSTGFQLIAVVMGLKEYGSQSNIKTFSKELLTYGFDNFQNKTLLNDNVVYKNVTVQDSIEGVTLDLITKGEVTTLVSKTSDGKEIIEVPHILEGISAPVNKGDLMGYVEVFKNGTLLGQVDLIAKQTIEMKPEIVVKNRVIEFITESLLVKILIVAVIFLVLLLILRFVLRRVSRRVNSRRRQNIYKM